MKCRIIYKADGSVVVIHPAPKSQLVGESEAVWLDRVFTRTIEKDPKLQGLAFDDVDTASLPSREFRNAWRGEKGKVITIDTAKKDIIINEKLIAEEIEKAKRDTAIDKLKGEGKLPGDYT